MKSAQLPPVRVEPAVRAEIESVLRQGETLSQFVESAAIQTAQRRKAQQEFLARGRASLKRAEKTGEYYSAKDALDAMQARLEARMAKLRPDGKSKPGKSAVS
ncbi:MAG: YlcI/YnfO family protein [Variovorax sp.]